MNNQPEQSSPILNSNATLPEALAALSEHIPPSLHSFLLEEYDALYAEIYDLGMQLESLEQEVEQVRGELAS